MMKMSKDQIASLSPEKAKDFIEAFLELNPRKQKMANVKFICRELEENILKAIDDGRDNGLQVYELLAIGLSQMLERDLEAVNGMFDALNNPDLNKVTDNVVPLKGKSDYDPNRNH